MEQINVSRYTVRNDSDPRSRLIATRRPKEGLLLVSVKSNIHRILINDSILLHGGLNFTSDETVCDAYRDLQNEHAREGRGYRIDIRNLYIIREGGKSPISRITTKKQLYCRDKYRSIVIHQLF